ncbi:MAG: succinyl-diaminopimelate desuccinylase [Gaiellaceae bacterium]
MSALADRLAARTLELVDIPSESGDEARIREHLISLIPPTFEVAYAEDDAHLFLPERRPRTPLVTLAGHYDTVPAQGNLPGRIADGAVHGVGASDMKGGLAVAVELVRDLGDVSPGHVDVALLLFGREELPYEHDPLPSLFASCPSAHQTALAILLEPTDGQIHVGCLGNIIARLTFRGTSGHSARPWLADNAIARAVDGLAPLLAHEPREMIVGGLPFVEVLSITRLDAGIADNVIPGDAVATLNFRYAPNRAPADAEAALRELVPNEAELEIVSHAPSGRVVTDSTLVGALKAAGGGLDVEPKQAWTNVADFTLHGIDAVNFGPGHTAYAHHRDEQVDIAALEHCYETLRRFLTGPIGEDSR